MGVEIKLENLEELEHICECIELCIKTDKIHPDNRETVRKIGEKLRNDFEEFSNLDKNRD